MKNSIKYAAYFPNLNPHQEWVQTFRELHDPKALLIPVHLTLVFPTQNISDINFRNEIKIIAKKSKSFFINFKSTTVVTEIIDDKLKASIYIISDEGFISIVQLQNMLYSGLLEPELRIGTVFTPHITIASGLDIEHANILSDILNQNNFSIRVELDHVEII